MVSTIVLLTDPQQGDAKGMSPDEKRQIESDANVGLNKLKNEKYPPAKIENNVYTIDITCSGQSISPDCIFFAGDLTQFGGNYNINEQADWSINPSNCIGGTQLQYHRSLYDPQFPKQGVVQPTQCGPLYFGLGNHDFENGEFGTNWRRFAADKWSQGPSVGAHDAYRYQMTNYISQMHTGYTVKHLEIETRPRFPIPAGNIDSTPNGTYDWTSYSLNYVVELPDVDIYQLHICGGYTGDGRKSGLDWLKYKLAFKGTTRPVIIVQHLMFSKIDQFWSKEGRDNLLEILSPYRVLFLGVGHLHDRDDNPPTFVEVPNTKGTWPAWYDEHLVEFRPGAIFNKRGGLIRVDTNPKNGIVTTNLLYGAFSADGPSYWDCGKSFSSFEPKVYIRGIQIVYKDKYDENDPDLPFYVMEIQNQNADINRGFGGKFVFVRPLLTDRLDDAKTGIEVWTSKTEDTKHIDLAKGAGGLYRYAKANQNPKYQPMRALFLLRSEVSRDFAYVRDTHGMAGMSMDINKDRKGDYLYFVWRTTPGPK